MLETVQWGTVADWVSGIGSLAAAIVALYIAYDSKKVRLSGYAGHRTMIGGGMPSVELFSVSATNISQRPTTITNISFSMGLFFWRRHGIITFMQGAYSHGIPKELTDGDRGSWSADLGQDEEWISDLVEKFKMKWIHVQTLRVYVHTSNGGSTKFVPERAFRKMIMKHVAKAKHG
jgi:hypothetical protein